MAGPSDKARFYIEQFVPELKEYEKKEIFSKEEITSIARKRSDFEHKLNVRGSHPSDYARYVEFEINLDALRRKRVKRLGVKVTSHSGQRRIYSILDRATRKFHGDVGLWMQYVDYARKHKAYKKLSQILTNMLRLHPTKPELWIYAARYVLEDQADMMEARSYMQRGLRFCKSSRKLWVEYGRLEMIYIAKIASRRKILGLDQSREGKVTEATLDDPDADMIAVPALTGEDITPNLSKDDDIDQVALQNLNSTPALTGAIPIVVFDTGMKQFDNDELFGKEFYDMVDEFNDLPCVGAILTHVASVIIHNMAKTTPGYLSNIVLVRSAVAGIKCSSNKFPSALGTALERLKSVQVEAPDTRFDYEIIVWLLSIFKVPELDSGLKKVCSATIRKMARSISRANGQPGPTKPQIEQLALSLSEAGLNRDADLLSGGLPT